MTQPLTGFLFLPLHKVLLQTTKFKLLILSMAAQPKNTLFLSIQKQVMSQCQTHLARIVHTIWMVEHHLVSLTANIVVSTVPLDLLPLLLLQLQLLLTHKLLKSRVYWTFLLRLPTLEASSPSFGTILGYFQLGSPSGDQLFIEINLELL